MGELSVTEKCVDILSVITSEVPVLTCLTISKSGQGPWSKLGVLSIMSLEDDMLLSSTSDVQGVLHLAGVSVIVCSSVMSVAWALVIRSSKISSDPDSLSEQAFEPLISPWSLSLSAVQWLVLELKSLSE